MLKNIVKLEHRIDDKIYTFICDNDCPIPNVKECLMKMLQYVGQIEDQILEQRKKIQEETKEKVEEVDGLHN